MSFSMKKEFIVSVNSPVSLSSIDVEDFIVGAFVAVVVVVVDVVVVAVDDGMTLSLISSYSTNRSSKSWARTD